MMNAKELMSRAAEVLQSSESMVQRNVEIWREDPGDKYYDPDWDVHLDQDEVAGLLRNLKDAAKLFDELAGNPVFAANLFRGHVNTQKVEDRA